MTPRSSAVGAEMRGYLMTDAGSVAPTREPPIVTGTVPGAPR
jgi:hypothetical protein